MTARPVSRQTGGPGSLGAGGTAGLEYSTLDRDELVGRLPWLDEVHRGALLACLRAATGEDLTPVLAPHALAMNVLDECRGYEWHVDGGDTAWVVSLQSRPWRSSGRFLFHDGQEVVEVAGEPGWGTALRSARYPHAVEPVLDGRRVSVLFTYTDPEHRLSREGDLSEYLGQGQGLETSSRG